MSDSDYNEDLDYEGIKFYTPIKSRREASIYDLFRAERDIASFDDPKNKNKNFKERERGGGGRERERVRERERE